MHRQIILIPGYYGSRLRDRISNALFWLSTFSLQKPEHALEGIRLPNSDGRVFVDGILDNFQLLLKIPIYHGLIAFLENAMGYARNEIHAVGVDWRRSVEDSVSVVAGAIDNAYLQSGQTVDLIAHSHGGLIARAYLDQAGGSKVERLITLGTPHNGMVETFEAMCQGITMLRFDAKQLMDVARGFPSAYELLPLDATDGYFIWNNAPASPFSIDAWCPSDDMKPLLAKAAQVTPKLSRQVPVRLFALHGTRTITTIRAVGPNDGATGVEFEYDENGDGTVPLDSGAARRITSTSTVMRFAIPFGGHAFLFDDQNTREVIRHILRSDPPPDAYFAAAWEHAMYLPGQQNRVAVQLDDFNGDPIPGGTVTLSMPTAGINAQPIPQDPVNNDYVLPMTMPGAGTQLPYVIVASAPTLKQPYHASGMLVAAAN
jgi:pimeloyl-ACP methyl ester carboxylesterase